VRSETWNRILADMGYWLGLTRSITPAPVRQCDWNWDGNQGIGLERNDPALELPAAGIELRSELGNERDGRKT
jgi:hypothetical protein